MNGVVLVDICGTIFDANTTFAFLDRVVDRKGYRLLRKVMHSLPWRAMNKSAVKFFHCDVTRSLAVCHLKGRSESELLAWADEFYDLELKNLVREQVLTIMEEYRRHGKTLVLASATLDFIAQTIARKLDVKYFFGTQLLYKDGICRGKIMKDRLGGKLSAALGLGFSPPYAATITDNWSDIDILKLSERKIVVIHAANSEKWSAALRRNQLTDIESLYV